MAISKTRVGTPLSAKPKKSDGDQFLLARGLSARYTGANTPLVPLTSEEMERDIRHMEAFANACTAYSQQFYISQNSNDDINDGKSTKALASPPIIAMPVRIDPEEEKRLTNLRQKIQQCEAQREILESQYLSLRAHYVYLSKKLKAYRGTVSGHVKFLQEQVQKRGKLVALQRARLQITREVLGALIYRHKVILSESDDSVDFLVEVWNKIEEKFKKAEKDCRSSGLESWHAMKVPQVPPGVPLMLSQLAKQPALAAAWSTGGMFGSNKDTMCWLEPLVPQNKDKSELAKELPRLREHVRVLRYNLEMEDERSHRFQSEIISCRKKNDGLVAMMALLRTETEAVVARHNIILQSEAAREAAGKLLSEEDGANGNDNKDSAVGETTEDGNAGKVVPMASKSDDPESYGDDERGAEDEEEIGGSKRALDGENGSPRSKRRKL